MRSILIICLAMLVFTCSNKNELDSVIEKNSDLNSFVDSLKTTSLIYKKCKDCNINGRDGKKFIGFTKRYPPNGNYDKKEIEIGEYEYDTYIILDSENDERTNGHIYICYFNQEQKEKFIDFLPYYYNRIGHHKLLCQVNYVNNTVIIITEIQG